jgi:hypothetical protein
MTSDRQRLDKAGRFIMEHLRDRGLEFVERLIAGLCKAPAMAALQDDVKALPAAQQDMIRRCVSASLDGALHDFLFKLSERADLENDIQLVVDGESVATLSDELQNEPYGDEGWIVRFSRHPPGP